MKLKTGKVKCLGGTFRKMRSFEQQYKIALKQIIAEGQERTNRTDTPAISMFDIGFKIDVSKHYPILTSKYIDIKIVNTEFEWFITGQTNTKLFKERGIKIWDQWADEDGQLGPVYGYQLVNFNGKASCNQLKAVIKSLDRNPFHRRHIISLWNPQQLNEMALPPCYLYFQFYVEGERLNMFVIQRSGDMFAGVPYDICLFTNLLNYIATKTIYTPGIISHRIVDAHIYTNHLEGIKQYLDGYEHYPPEYNSDLFGNINLSSYKHLPAIKIPIAK